MNRFAHAIFCDDIRQELGGKFTFVGVYGDTLLVPAFPAILPKLCVVVHMATPGTHPFKGLKLQVLMGDSILAEGAFDGVAATDELFEGGPEHVLRVSTHATFSPLKVDGPERIRVRILTEDGEIPAGSLQIHQNPAFAAGTQVDTA